MAIGLRTIDPVKPKSTSLVDALTGDRATALDGKYVSWSWRRDALSIRNSVFGRGVLATRHVLSIEPDDPVWAVPAPFIVYALDRPDAG